MWFTWIGGGPGHIYYTIPQLDHAYIPKREAQTMHYGKKVANFKSVYHYKVTGSIYSCTPREYASLYQVFGIQPQANDQFVIGSGKVLRKEPYYESEYTFSYDRGWSKVTAKHYYKGDKNHIYSYESGPDWKAISADGTKMLSKSEWDRKEPSVTNQVYEWNPESQPQDLEQFLTLATSLKQEDDALRFASLALPAFESLHATNTNNLEFLADANLIKQILELAAAVKAPGKTLKEVASIYLSYSFGAAATARDYATTADDLFRYAQRCKTLTEHMHRKLRSRATHSDTFAHCPMSSSYNMTAYVDNLPSGIMKMMATAQEWGLYPTASAMWDFIPFSFVVDWFANAKESMARKEYNVWRQYYNCHASITSLKRTLYYNPRSANPNSLNIGNVVITAYERTVSPQLPVALDNLELRLPGAHSWMAGGALVIQKIF